MLTRRSFLSRFAILTGSVAFGVATPKSDEDWLIRIEHVKELGIPAKDVNEYGDPLYACAGFCTYREGNVNLIIARTDSFYQRWLKAHRHCIVEQPKSRARRIAIFRHYLYGKGFLN